MNKELKIIISAVTKGVGDVRKMSQEFTTGGRRVREAGRVFKDTMRGSAKQAGLLGGQIKSLIGAWVGFAAIGKTVAIVKQSDAAIFNMRSSVAAANREFNNVGSVESWENAIGRMSDRLVIYSDTALRGAIARTVDMTKRLGLNQQQMEEVIARSADLGAGKVDLEGAIERVTAALRGEAESAEYLGLTLNENYVKAWYEASDAQQKAWKDLTDLEKAQVRYQVLMEQSAELQGRAAQSAKTFGGALQLVQKEITNAVTKNKKLVGVLNQVAASLRKHSGEIGEVIANIISLGATVAEGALKYRKWIAALVGSYVAVTAISKLVGVFRALEAASKALLGMDIAEWLAVLVERLGAATLGSGALAASLQVAVAAAAAYGVVQIGRLVAVIAQWAQAAWRAREAQRKMVAQSDKALNSLERFKDVKLPDDITGSAPEDLARLQWELLRARDYYTVLTNKMNSTGNTAGIEDAEARLAEIRGDLIEIGDSAKEALEKPTEAVKATTEELDAFEEKAKAAYEKAKAEALKYAEEIEDINRRIAERGLDTEDKIRELKRRNLSEEEAAADVRLEAIEKIRAANRELARYQTEDSDQARDNAKRFFDDAARLWEQYAGQGEEATSEAITGLEQIKTGLDALDQTEIGWIQRMKTEAETVAAEIEDRLEQLTRDREAHVNITLRNLQAVQQQLADFLNQPRDIWVTVHQRTVEEHAAGGMAGAFRRRRGLLAGFGGGDKIKSLLEAGEYIIRKEVVAKFGRGFFDALNGMRLALPDIDGLVRARLGGLVAAMPVPAFAGGGIARPTETMILELAAGGARLPLRVSGNAQTMRQGVRAIEKELRRMRLSHP